MLSNLVANNPGILQGLAGNLKPVAPQPTAPQPAAPKPAAPQQDAAKGPGGKAVKAAGKKQQQQRRTRTDDPDYEVDAGEVAAAAAEGDEEMELGVAELREAQGKQNNAPKCPSAHLQKHHLHQVAWDHAWTHIHCAR
jgi:hypothetical protein